MRGSRWFSLRPPKTPGLGLLFGVGALLLAYQIFRAFNADLTWIAPLGTFCVLVAISLMAQPRGSEADDRAARAENSSE